MTESPLLKEIQLAAADAGIHLFRNNVGNGYVGKFVRTLPNGDVVLTSWRRIQFGLCVGSADLIGWTPTLILPEHVGRTLPVFTGLEIKTPAGQLTPEQRAFLDALDDAGGITGAPRSVPDALATLQRK